MTARAANTLSVEYSFSLPLRLFGGCQPAGSGSTIGGTPSQKKRQPVFKTHYQSFVFRMQVFIPG